MRLKSLLSFELYSWIQLSSSWNIDLGVIICVHLWYNHPELMRKLLSKIVRAIQIRWVLSWRRLPNCTITGEYCVREIETHSSLAFLSKLVYRFSYFVKNSWVVFRWNSRNLFIPWKLQRAFGLYLNGEAPQWDSKFHMCLTSTSIDLKILAIMPIGRTGCWSDKYYFESRFGIWNWGTSYNKVMSTAAASSNKGWRILPWLWYRIWCSCHSGT